MSWDPWKYMIIIIRYIIEKSLYQAKSLFHKIYEIKEKIVYSNQAKSLFNKVDTLILCLLLKCFTDLGIWVFGPFEQNHP